MIGNSNMKLITPGGYITQHSRNNAISNGMVYDPCILLESGLANSQLPGYVFFLIFQLLGVEYLLSLNFQTNFFFFLHIHF